MNRTKNISGTGNSFTSSSYLLTRAQTVLLSDDFSHSFSSPAAVSAFLHPFYIPVFFFGGHSIIVIYAGGQYHPQINFPRPIKRFLHKHLCISLTYFNKARTTLDYYYYSPSFDLESRCHLLKFDRNRIKILVERFSICLRSTVVARLPLPLPPRLGVTKK